MPIPDDAAWLPSTSDLARQLRNRAYVGGGRAPDFLDEGAEGGPTDPTRTEALAFIQDARSDLESRVGTIPEGAEGVARRVLVLGAALLIEVGSEDFDQERYDRLQALYDARLTQLLDAVQDIATGGEPGDADDRVLAVGSFDCPVAPSDMLGDGFDGLGGGSERSWDVIGKNGLC